MKAPIETILTWMLVAVVGSCLGADMPLNFTLNATPAASLSLNGQWQVARDPEDIGKIALWYRGRPVPGAAPVEVPNPIELTFPGYDGVIWYWRTFESGDFAKYDNVRLHFQGADYFAEAWLNGKYLGGNESALLPFAFDAKKAIRAGANLLVVRVVDTSYQKEFDGFQLGHVPGGRQADDPMQQGWRHQNYGGLLLPVSVEAFRQPWIADGFIRPNVKERKVNIDLVVTGGNGGGPWEAIIRPIYPKPGDPVVHESVWLKPDVNGHASISLKIPNPRLWNVWDAFLYEVSLMPANGTTWKQRFGMREISVHGGRIAINGKPKAGEPGGTRTQRAH